MLHIIIGIPLPQSVKQILSLNCCGLSNAHWIQPEQLYLSLIDMDYRDAAEVIDIAEAVKSLKCSPFQVNLAGIAKIPTGHANHVIAATILDQAPLSKLKNSIINTLREQKITIELKHFNPHVPLGMLAHGNATKASQFFIENQNKPLAEFRADRFAIFEIKKTPKQLLCDEIASFPFLESPSTPSI